MFRMYLLLLSASVSLFGCGALFSPLGGDATEENTQSNLRFNRLPIEYKIASTIPESFREEVRSAFDEWNQSTGQEVFRFIGIKELGEDELSHSHTFGENVVLITNRSGQIGPEGNPATPGSGPLARTSLKGGATILDADIYLYEFDLNYRQGRPGTGDVYSVRTVVLHEAGHMLFGPDHSDDPQSVLATEIFPRNHPSERLGLASSDIERFFLTYGTQ